MYRMDAQDAERGAQVLKEDGRSGLLVEPPFVEDTPATLPTYLQGSADWSEHPARRTTTMKNDSPTWLRCYFAGQIYRMR